MCISLVISWGVGGLDCWWGNDSLCILQKCIKITEDWWNCCTFIDFYNCELSVQWLYSVHIYELIINGILYNLNEKINQKYTVSFLLSIHLVIWLSNKLHIREANPTKVEKCLWSAKWARIPVYETMSVMKNRTWFRSLVCQGYSPKKVKRGWTL